jgi:deazaflavin-dependent oxidoreductase (nitroreductase family)
MDKESTQTNSSIKPVSNRSFPVTGTPLADIIVDISRRNSFHRNIQLINRYVVALYRIGLLPLFGAGKTTMLLMTKGRISKQLRCFPVGYVRVGGEIYLISGWGKDSNWYKNILANPEDVRLQIGFRRFNVRAKFNELPRGKPRGIRRAAIADRKPFCSSWPDPGSLHSGESVLHRHTAQLYSYSNHLTRTRRPRVVVSQQALGGMSLAQ